MRKRFSRFFLTIVVVQNVPLRMIGSSMATGCDVIKRHVTPKRFRWKGGVRACATGSCAISALVGPFHRKRSYQTSPDPFGVPLEGWDARMRNRKLRNIQSTVTRRASPGNYGSAHARSEVPLRCSLGHPDPITLSFSTNYPFHWFSAPFPPFYFHGGAFNNYTIILSGVFEYVRGVV